LDARLEAKVFTAMTSVEWFIIGGIIVAATDEVINRSSLKENSTVQLILGILKRVFPKRG